jgi:hypothetical protein
MNGRHDGDEHPTLELSDPDAGLQGNARPHETASAHPVLGTGAPRAAHGAVGAYGDLTRLVVYVRDGADLHPLLRVWSFFITAQLQAPLCVTCSPIKDSRDDGACHNGEQQPCYDVHQECARTD